MEWSKGEENWEGLGMGGGHSKGSVRRSELYGKAFDRRGV